MSINYATFSGTITRDSIRQGVTVNGKAWASFRISSSNSSYDKETGTYKKEPSFYCDCVAFGKLATLIEPVLQDGVSLLVSGHLTTEGYIKKDGTAGVNNHLTCENVAVNCVPWQTTTVTVNNSTMSATGSSQTVPSTQQTPVQAQQTVQQPVQQYPTSGSWNTIPTTAQQQQYTMSGAAALGISDDPGF